MSLGAWLLSRPQGFCAVGPSSIHRTARDGGHSHDQVTHQVSERENPGQLPWPPLLTREGQAVGEARPIRGRSSSGLLVQPATIE